MRLSRVRLINYRSCLHTQLELDASLSTLIGVNGSGKTNILHGILLLKQLSHVHPRHRPADSIANRCRLFCDFIVRGKRLKYEATIKLRTGRRIDEEIAFVSEAWKSPDILGSNQAIHFPLSLGDYVYYGNPRSMIRYMESGQLPMPFLHSPGRESGGRTESTLHSTKRSTVSPNLHQRLATIPPLNSRTQWIARLLSILKRRDLRDDPLAHSESTRT